MNSRSMAGLVTIGLLAAFCYVAFMVVVITPVLLSTLVEGGWSIVITIVGFLVATGIALRLYARLARWRHIADASALFPGYRGERVPIYSLLSVADERGEARGSEHHQYSLGIAEDQVFLMQHRQREPETQVSGKMVLHHGRPVNFSGRALSAVEVIDRDDDAIAAGAVDRRDYGERLGSVIGQALTGTRVKTRIVPFASYVVLSDERGDGWTQLVAAIPTEVDGASLKALGSSATGTTQTSSVIGTVAGLGSEPIGAAAASLGRGTVGDGIADFAGGASDVVGHVGTLINPDAAEIATTKGSRGRLMARLIADRLRGVAGA